ncbi:MAG TPA: transcriptional regulator [Mycobacteriales bacterium]|nr:transcriptional regulator [Mycobacteriales bacterium]
MTDSFDHPTADFDESVHQPNRLAILVVLREAGRADFGYLKQTLGLTDGNLGRHLSSLEEAGLVELSKGFEGRRPRTWAKLTPKGRRALDAELVAMRRLLQRFGG